MNVTVKLFAVLRDKAGTRELTLDLPPGSTVESAGRAVVERLPALREHARAVAYAVNRSYAAVSTPLQDGDELALIPPVSGG